jgi:hypothetical protein
MGVGGFAVPWLCLRDANLGQDRGAKLPTKTPFFWVVHDGSIPNTGPPLLFLTRGEGLGRVLANNAHATIAGACISG